MPTFARHAFLLCLLGFAAGIRGESQPREAGAELPAATVPGRVVGIIDGDTLDLRLASGMLRVRLHGVDAPERGQPWGDAARRALASLAFGREVQLEPIEQDRYDRQVARVWLDGRDLNARLIEGGHAWVYRRYASEAEYCRLEAAARTQGIGLWGLSGPPPVAPWEWRQRESLGQVFKDYSQTTTADCQRALRTQRRTGARPERSGRS